MALNVVPNSGQTLNNSRAPIAANFVTIDTAFSVDHVTYNLATQGEHNRVFFVQQGAAVATPGATDAALYTKAGTGGANSLFYRGASNATPLEISYAAKATAGYTTLPSGIMLQWGSATIKDGTAQTNFPTPFLGGCLNVQITAQYHSGNKNFLSVDTFTLKGFRGYSKPMTSGYESAVVYYFAIGY